MGVFFLLIVGHCVHAKGTEGTILKILLSNPKEQAFLCIFPSTINCVLTQFRLKRGGVISSELCFSLFARQLFHLHPVVEQNPAWSSLIAFFLSDSYIAVLLTGAASVLCAAVKSVVVHTELHNAHCARPLWGSSSYYKILYTLSCCK